MSVSRGWGAEVREMTTARNSQILCTIPVLLAVCLLAFPAQAQYSGGTGEPNDPYLIYTAEHLNALGAEPNDYDKHFKLMADIDLSGYTYDRAVIAPASKDAYWPFDGTPFTGVFDGDGHIVSYLIIAGGSHLGLFGQVGPGAKMSNLGVESVNVNGANSYGLVGSIAGSNAGSIIACYSSGAVTGNWEVGGLVGLNWPGGDLTDCHSAARVSGDLRVGGLAGCNVGQITHCHSTGPVRGGESLGGLIGGRVLIQGHRILTAIGTATHCFWDIETSGQVDSDGGAGKTTAEMQTATTFLEAGWDFADETENGTEDIWWILEGQDYPRLWWELNPEN